MNFLDFHSEIVKRAKESGACLSEYSKALRAKDFAELFDVICENFNWCCENKTIDVELLSQIPTETLNENSFFVNVSTSKGYLLASGSATVEAWGSAYINSYNTIEHKISEKVILRYYYENRIVLAPGIGETKKLEQ